MLYDFKKLLYDFKKLLYDFKKLSGCLTALESSTSQTISRLSDWKNREGADELSMAIWN
jgi:hypothetical protein